mmetsp:Transcript_14219/g.21866  ORF Transcript_14219/g.21866 Transcript_14219/m.21866 type:complete len:86 (-) Transcript_14219:377-634(-)
MWCDFVFDFVLVGRGLLFLFLVVRVCRDRARAGAAGVAAADLINQHLEADGVRLCCVNKWRSVGPARFSTIRFWFNSRVLASFCV